MTCRKSDRSHKSEVASIQKSKNTPKIMGSSPEDVAQIAASQQQRSLAEKQRELESACMEVEFRLKQLEIDKQLAVTQAELVVYEQADSEDSDPEVTFPKLARSPQQNVLSVNQCTHNTQSVASGAVGLPQSSMMNLTDSLCKSVQRTQLPKLKLSSVGWLSS